VDFKLAEIIPGAERCQSQEAIFRDQVDSHLDSLEHECRMPLIRTSLT
jgi:hypothetical protein